MIEPFSFDELCARINTLIQESHQRPSSPPRSSSTETVSSEDPRTQQLDTTLLLLVENPPAQNFVARIVRIVATITLVSILLARLEVERFTQELAAFDISQIDALLQGSIVDE